MLFVKCCVYILTLYASTLFSATINLLDCISEIKETCMCFMLCNQMNSVSASRYSSTTFILLKYKAALVKSSKIVLTGLFHDFP